MATLSERHPLARPAHLFLSIDGCLYDTRDPAWMHKPPLRADYVKSHREIANTIQLKATLRAGKTTDFGGYPLFFITIDGSSLSFEWVMANIRSELDAVMSRYASRIIGCEVNYEDASLTCDGNGQKIPSAYGDDDDVQEEG